MGLPLDFLRLSVTDDQSGGRLPEGERFTYHTREP